MAGEWAECTVDGIRVRLLHVGDPSAQAVVLIHGWASSSSMWGSTIRLLDRTHYCVALNLPGHGGSQEIPADRYTIPSLARLVEGLINDLGLQRPTVVGHSMGGTIGLQMAANRRTELSRLILINPVVNGRIGPWAIGSRRLGPLLAMTMRIWPVATWILGNPPDAVARRWPVQARRMRQDLAHTTPSAAAGCLRAVVDHDLSLLLPHVDTPTLFILGGRDRVVSPRGGLAAALRMPMAQTRVLDAAHHPFDEAPGIYRDALLPFLTAATDGHPHA